MSAILENAVGGLIANEAHGFIALLLSRIREELRLAWGFKSELEELQRQLTKLSWLLEGASYGPITNRLMNDWLNKIKDAANDADDFVDEWSYGVLKSRFQTRRRDTLKRIFSDPVGQQMAAHKVKGLRKVIDSIYEEAEKLGIKPIKVAAGEVYNGYRSSLETEEMRLRDKRQWVDLECFVGRVEATTLLVESLCEASSKDAVLTVIGVTGMAGLGKTTLCKKVSKHVEVIEKFGSLVLWLVVSRSYNRSDLLKRMVEILFKTACIMTDDQAVVEKLREKLKDQRYLLILDDVWDTLDWEPLMATLLEIGGLKGTTLLVTARYPSVVNDMEIPPVKTFVHPLQVLKKDDSWSLLMARLRVGHLDCEKKELMARRMLKKCGGVPLAIRALGYLLRDKSVGMWEEIEKSEIWKKEDKSDILPSLKLTFNYLPNVALKMCFSYCAIFEEDEVIYKDRLIYMWMAQGFLHPYDKMELIGEDYCNILLNCSFFQDVQTDKHGKVIKFQMHDLVRSLARFVSGEYGPTYCKERTHLTGRFSANLDIAKNYSRLRVLRIDKGKFLKLGSPLKHLRYLHLDLGHKNESVIAEITKIAEEIAKLHHLQTLLVSSTYSTGSDLLQHIDRLVNLRHLSFDFAIGIPEGLKHLTSLRTLSAINMDQSVRRLDELGPLQNLQGTLEIKSLNYIDKEEARSLDLKNKLNVHELVLEWNPTGHTRSHNEILEALQPHANLAMLLVDKYMGTRYPRWLIERDPPLHSLVSLTLSSCGKAEGILDLANFKFLRFLEVLGCQRLTISFPIDGFICSKLLEVMRVYSCCKVENLPDLSSLTQLRILEIRRNENKDRRELVGMASLPCLRELWTDDEFILPADLGKDSPVCKSLELIKLSGTSTCDSLPIQLQYLVALQKLHLKQFLCLEILPDWLRNLTSLRLLRLVQMPKLKHLPSQDAMESLSNLKKISFLYCPLLNKDFKNKTGEWHKISHISRKEYE